MKTCHVITRMIVGGAQGNTLFTCRGHLASGHQVTLVTGPSPGPEGELLTRDCPEGLQVVTFPQLVRELSPLKDWQAYCKLKAFFKAENFDVVHTHASKAGILGRCAARAANVPLIVHTVHGQAFHPYQSQLINKAYILAERFAAKRCDKIFAVAQAMIDQCVNAKVAPREKYKVVYSGMDLDAFLNTRPDDALRQQLGIPEGAPVIGKIARLFELKGHEDLIEAAPQIVAKFPNARFLIVGDGILHDQLVSQIESLGLRENFIFTGLVSPSEICRYTALMDVLAHLSLREGLPRAVVQALASGVPVVAYPLDGTPEVVKPNVNGLLPPVQNIQEVANAICQLLDNPEKRRQWGKNGQELVRNLFDWRQMADILEQEYILGLKQKNAYK